MPSRTRRILIIDDDPLLREIVAAALSDAGYVPMEAASGAQGIEQVLRSPPDLVLCDLLMPGVDGFGVLARLRAEPATAGVPFVFITASTDHGDTRLGVQLGANDYLHKPIDNEALLAVVEQRLAAASAARQA